MKKLLTVALALVLCLSTVAIFSGCGNSVPYSKYDLSEYIELPDYNSYEVTSPVVEITDADIDERLVSLLAEAATTQEVTEGTVEEGDSISIAFEGTLADGTSADGMSSDGHDIVLGSANMIDGFEEGLYGATIGQEVTLDLTFPDPYTVNEELSGKDVTFKVTVLSKNVEVIPEFDENFVQNNSEYETTDEYRAALADTMEQEEYDNQLYDIKYEFYTKMVDETTVIKYPEKELKAQIKELEKTYKQLAKNNDVDWEDYMTDTLGVDQEGFDEQIELYAQELVKQEMIIYAIAKNENLSVSEEEYDAYLQSMLDSSGFEDEAAFKEYAGMSLEKYAETYKLDRDLLLTKELDTIYDRLIAAQNGETADSDDSAEATE